MKQEMFLFFYILIYLIKLILWLKFSTDKKQTEEMKVGEGKDHRVLLHFTWKKHEVITTTSCRCYYPTLSSYNFDFFLTAMRNNVLCQTVHEITLNNYLK